MASFDRARSGETRIRSLDTGAAFWLAMFTASAFGTNLGDWWVDDAGMDGPAGLLILAALCLAAIGLDRRAGLRSEAWYWVAIVALRAGATNIADAARHTLGLGFPVLAATTGLAALAAGLLTHPGARRAGSPAIDRAYWVTMLIAGIFGTIAGDWASRTLGLAAAAAVLALVLLAVLWSRRQFFPAAILAYWATVLVERSAATPAGDWLASHRGLGLGLPLAMLCTGGMFAAALLWRRHSGDRLPPPV